MIFSREDHFFFAFCDTKNPSVQSVGEFYLLFLRLGKPFFSILEWFFKHFSGSPILNLVVADDRYTDTHQEEFFIYLLGPLLWVLGQFSSKN